MFQDDYRDDRRQDRGRLDRDRYEQDRGRDFAGPDPVRREGESRGFARNEAWGGAGGRHERRDDPRRDDPRFSHDLRDGDGRYDRADARRPVVDDRRPGVDDRRPDVDDRRGVHDEPTPAGGRAGGAWEFGRADRRYSLDDTRRALPMEETDRLISSDKVEGTAVYDLTGRRVGEVRNFMVEKRSGRVAYAVVRIRGGFVAGETYRPVDWNDLHYHDRLDGYQIDMERHELRRDRSFEDRR